MELAILVVASHPLQVLMASVALFHGVVRPILGLAAKKHEQKSPQFYAARLGRRAASA